MKKPRNFDTTTWLDLLDEDNFDSEAVIKNGQVSPEEASGYGESNLIYDRETDTVFALLSDAWPPAAVVAETLDQYEPGEL